VTCVECGSGDAELVRGDDGHFRKECGCGHVGGPYVSRQIRGRQPGEAEKQRDEGQAGLGDFA
jgi:hypothetical protein